MKFPATVERGALRAFVPIELAFACPGCGGTDAATAAGMIDTGAPSSVMPADQLPGVGHLTWDDLADEAPGVRVIRGQMEARWWNTEVFCLGVRFATRIKVYRGSRPDFPVLGLDDFGTAFRMAFDFGADPPSFDIEPYSASRGPVHLQQFPVIDYGHTQIRLGADLVQFARQPPTLPAGAAQRQLEPPRPSRAVRRAQARRK